MYILGINAYHGDAAAAIVRDGELIAAVEEERFNRVKHCAGFPAESVRYCLEAAGVRIEDVEHIGISRDPSAHLHKKILFAAKKISNFEFGISNLKTEEISKLEIGNSNLKTEEISKLEFGISNLKTEAGVTEEISNLEDADKMSALQGKGISTLQGNGNSKFEIRNSKFSKGIFAQIKDRLGNAAKVRDLKDDLAKALGVSKNSFRAQFHNIEHHRAHLASSFYCSPFERAALLSIDGFGDFISTMWAEGNGNSIKVLGQVEYPHSTGIVYTATTQFLGFPHYGDEGKVMGLAPYGQPRFIEEFRDIIRAEQGGKFKLNLDYFRHHAEGVDMTWDQGSPVIGRIFSDAFARTFGPPRAPGAPLTDREQDIAASLQLRLEEVGFHVLHHLHEQTGFTDLGLSGGVAYNSVMNGKILLNTPFRRLFIQPAAGDSGTALGACYEIYNRVTQSVRLRRHVTQSVRLRRDVTQSVRLRPSDSDANAQTNSLRYTEPDSDTHAQTNSLRYTEPDGDTHAQTNTLRYTEPDSDTHAQTNSLRYTEPDGDTHAQTNSLRYTEPDSDTHPQTNSLRYTEPDGYADAQTNSLRYVMLGAYTGPEFSNDEIRGELQSRKLSFETYTDDQVTKRAAQDIADGLVVGWFQGRMEFGPRALGNRSIVVDPRRAEMKDILNERIKKREPFRPFAPSILEEFTAEYFEQSHPAPTMLMVYQIKPERRAQIPAVTHVDGSGRLQTVSREVNPRYYQLISDFHQLTGVPVVLNTSFNENEPIVCTPRHAIDCFLKTRMDVLYLGNHAVRRTNVSDT